MNINIVLLGASGDLANKKILPAVGEFINYCENYNINLIPWSRSVSNIPKITESINKDYKTYFKIEKTFEGDYNNYELINDFLESNSDSLNIFYLSLPPIANFAFIECMSKITMRNFEIIVEKPFAISFEEFCKLDELVINSRLQSKVNYLDHYLFKDTYNFNPTIAKFLSKIQHRRIVQAHIKIQEKIDIQSRINFYDSTGCINDMFFHTFDIFTAFNKCLIDYNLSLTPSNFKIVSLIKGQYASYIDEVGKNSDTETAFQLILDCDNIKITMESSKKMDTKLTQLELQFDDQSQLTWNIYPNGSIEYFSNASYLNVNLKTTHSDHYNIFWDLANGKKDRFLDSKNIVVAYSILDKLKKDKTKPTIY